jgi:RNA polymerase sigma-70 factor (ECF subfamily)
MHERIDRLPGTFVTVDQDEALAREFEGRLVECATLAFRVAYGVLRHHQDAEDVAQDALARAYRSFGQLRDRDRFRQWLVRMTWRLAIDRQRGERRRLRREQAVAADPAVDPARDARAAQLWQAIDALPEKMRMVVVLAGIQGHDLREVATLLKVPEGTVKSRYFAARQRIREWLA